jgi:toxin CcdB
LPRQFDIVENRNPASRIRYPYLVVLQHDRLTSIRSIIAAPLIEATAALMATRMHPSISVDGQRFIILTEELAAIPSSGLGRTVNSAEAQRYEIIAALDLLFTGI